MFLAIPFYPSEELRQVLFLLNSILLIGMLIVAELAYSDAHPQVRRHLYTLYPLMAVCGGILLYAMYLQMGGKT